MENDRFLFTNNGNVFVCATLLLMGLFPSFGCRTAQKEQPMLVVEGVVYEGKRPLLTDAIRVYDSGRYEYTRCKLPRYPRMEFHGQLQSSLVAALRDVAYAIAPKPSPRIAKYIYPLEASHNSSPKPIEDLYGAVYADVYADLRRR